MLVMTDREILEKHDKSLRHRASLELKLVDQLIKSAAEKNYILKVEEFEDDCGEYDFKTSVFDLDEANVLVYDKNGEYVDGKYIGWIHLVFGNDGWDLISDYTVNLEDFLKDCNDLSNKLEEGLDNV